MIIKETFISYNLRILQYLKKQKSYEQSKLSKDKKMKKQQIGFFINFFHYFLNLTFQKCLFLCKMV